jgi:hypothetical protein
MESIIQVTSKRVNQWNNGYISPGPVSSIGDVLQNVRLKQSAPELPMRFLYNDYELEHRGQNVQDGQWFNFTSGGYAAKTVVRDSYNAPYETNQIGISTQELRPTNLASSTRVAARPQDSWKSQAGQTMLSKTTGIDFRPLPHGYPNTGVSRGPQPRRNFVGEDPNYQPGRSPAPVRAPPKDVDPETGRPEQPEKPGGERCRDPDNTPGLGGGKRGNSSGLIGSA